MNIDLLTKYHLHLTNILNTDVLAEVFAALMLNDGLISEKDDVYFLPSRNKTRTYKNDIVHLKKLKDENYDDKYLEIGTSRASIVNGIPESFYIDQSKEEGKTPEERDAIRQVFNQILNSAHTYFKPIEIEYNKTRIDREYNELKLNKNNSDLLHVFWGEQRLGSVEEERFLKTMHLLPYITGNLRRTELLINYILEKKSKITLKTEALNQIPEKLHATLGKLHLGVNTYLNNCTYTYTKIALVNIHGISNDEFHLYYRKTKLHRIILDKIERYYFPLDVTVNYQFNINYDTSFFKLDEVYEKGNGILGYSTRI